MECRNPCLLTGRDVFSSDVGMALHSHASLHGSGKGLADEEAQHTRIHLFAIFSRKLATFDDQNIFMLIMDGFRKIAGGKGALRQMWYAKARAVYPITCDRLDERSATLAQRVALFLVFSTLAVLNAAASARAQTEPTPIEEDATNIVSRLAPVPSSSFCVNTRTGAIRMQLNLNGLVQSCKPIELGIDLQSLEQLAAEPPTPAALVTRPIPQTASEAIVSPPIARPPRVIDANGKLVGTIIGYDENQAAIYTEMAVGAQAIALPSTIEGFVGVDSSIDSYYTSNTCDSPPIFALLFNGGIQVITPEPSEVSTIGGGYITPSAQVLDDTLFYGIPNGSQDVLAEITFIDPTFTEILESNSCPPTDGLDGAVPGALLRLSGSAPAIADLSGFAPAFDIQH
jgi:hypothetical protein